MPTSMTNDLLIEVIQKIYHQGIKDGAGQTNDSKNEYFDIMARKIRNLFRQV